jgi:predicted nucleic acid-binding protein
VAWVIIDSSVYIGHWERCDHQAPLEQVQKTHVIRQSAVVLSELRRGARTRAGQRLVETLARIARTAWEPTATDWWEAGRWIRKLGDARQWDVAKRREFQNDTLIALTARRHGASILTANHADFDLLARHLRVRVLHA